MNFLKINAPILIVVFLLLFLGLMMVCTTSGLKEGANIIKKHIIYIFLGILSLLFFSALKYRILIKMIPFLFFFSIILMVVAILFGPYIKGAHRWIRFFGFSFQPSELLKLSFIMYFSYLLTDKQKSLKDFHSGVFPLLFILGASLFLLILQKDLGTAVLLGVVGIILLFMGGVRIRYLFCTLAASLPILLFLIFSESYRLKRIVGFLDPWSQAKGAGYHLVHSLLALGSGGIWGKGWGMSTQKLGFLPEAGSDFIFSILGEELGFIGALLVVILFVIFLWEGMKIARSCSSLNDSLIAVGITSMISLQAVIHIGVGSGCFPTKGITLPWVSLGGSSIVCNMTAVGILINLYMRKIREKRKRFIISRISY
jgi:cell division protein FtsW